MSDPVVSQRHRLAFVADWPLMALLSFVLSVVQLHQASLRQQEFNAIREKHARTTESLRTSTVRYESIFGILSQFVDMASTDPDAAIIVRKYGIAIKPTTNAPAAHTSGH